MRLPRATKKLSGLHAGTTIVVSRVLLWITWQGSIGFAARTARLRNYLQRLSRLRSAATTSTARVTILKNWGQVYRFQGHFDKALEYYQKALDTIADTHNDFVQAQVLEEIGSVYGHMGQYPEGVRDLESAARPGKENRQRPSGTANPRASRRSVFGLGQVSERGRILPSCA